MARPLRTVLGLALVLTMSGCTTPAQTPDPEPRVIAEGLDAPWSITFHDGVPLVSERDSHRILRLDDQGGVRRIGRIPDAAGSGEGGLLGIAAHESYLYTYFSAADGNRITRQPIEEVDGELSLGEAEVLLASIPAAAVHNGGRLAFGPDGMLYATTGDAGVPDRAQDRSSLAGKILRLTPAGGVPADNPFEDSPVYSYGHRNPQGLAWGPDGALYASEFGQNSWDELNRIEPGGNYGWPHVEGIAESRAQDTEYIDPIQQWRPAQASPSGMAQLDGTLYVANLRGQRLRAIGLDDPASAAELWAGDYGRLRDAVSAPDGSLWVLTNNTDGRGSPGADDDRILSLEPTR